MLNFSVEQAMGALVVRTGNVPTTTTTAMIRGLARDIAGEIAARPEAGAWFVMNHTPTTAQIASLPARNVCVAGEPVLVYQLVQALSERGLTAVSAVSDRKVIETVNSDGTVTKTSLFEHAGYRAFEG
jgi:hypothetical protein